MHCAERRTFWNMRRVLRAWVVSALRLVGKQQVHHRRACRALVPVCQFVSEPGEDHRVLLRLCSAARNGLLAEGLFPTGQSSHSAYQTVRYGTLLSN